MKKDFVLTYCSNGDLLSLIKKFKRFDLDKAKFYAAELVDALEYMHSKKVVHR
jgi:3-phosphoinositide dependent protein kinase-1